jgi:hypothetical protein
MNGHSTSGCALVTGWGDLSDLEEKKFDIRSLNDGEPAGAAGAAAGGEPAWGAGAEAAGAAVVATGVPMLPLQPATSSDPVSRAAEGAKMLQVIGRNLFGIPKSSRSARSRSKAVPSAMPRILYQANRGHPKALFSGGTGLG